MSILRLLIAILIIFTSYNCEAQLDSVLQTAKDFPEKYISVVSDKISDVDNKLSKQTLRALNKFEKEEAKFKSKLLKKDSATIKEIFANSTENLEKLKNDFINMPDKAVSNLEGEYNAYLDTLKSSFKYLEEKGQNIIGKTKLVTDKLSNATSKLNVLEGKLQKAEDIKRYLRERKEIIRQQLEKYGMVKQLKKIDKSVYYYSQYITEYKSILKDKKKIEQKALSLLYKNPAFKKFVSQNSLFGSLFPQGTGSGSGGLTQAQLMQGLQSRAGVTQYLKTNVSAGGPNVSQIISQQMQAANGELTKLKDKIAKYGGDGEMPSFKPNSYKTKSFLKRIEYGTNIQFSKSSTYFPSASDIALSLGYKLNDKSVIGIGASYKLGLGKNITNMKLTTEGLSLRSYVDWKIKWQFYISGGYEQNYLTTINRTAQLSNNSPWVQSGLIGISKKYQATKKFKGKIQILYDFLSNTHVPKTQAIIFRTGFNFK